MTLSKKIFIASSVVFIGTLLLRGVYNLSFKEKKAAEVLGNLGNKESSQSPAPSNTSKNARIAAISDDKAVSPVLSNDGNAISYYSKSEGKIFQVDLDGNNKKTFYEKYFPGIENILWSPDKNQALFKSKSPEGKITFLFYSFLTKNASQLNENIPAAFWENNQKIIYTYTDPQKKSSTLSISNPDGKEWKKLADLSYAGQKIATVPESGLLSFWNNPDANYETNLFTISPVSEKMLLFKGKFGGDFLWNPQGTKLIVSHSNEKNGKKIELAVADNKGQGYKNLELPTFVSKCVWAKNGKDVFCALPGDMPANSILPNSYTQREFFTTDTFWKIDTETGKKTRVVDLNEIKDKYDAQNLFFNLDESRLFFINRYDEKIYRISL